MKLLMENWRGYLNEEEEYEETLELFIEHYTLNNNILLTEGVAENIRKALDGLTKRYGKKAMHIAFLGMMVANTLSPAMAQSADSSVPEQAVATQQIQQSGPIRDWLKSDQGQEVQNQIMKTFEKVSGAVKDTAQDILRPNMADGGSDVSVAAESGLEDGYRLSPDGVHEYRVTLDANPGDVAFQVELNTGAKPKAADGLRAQDAVPDDARGVHYWMDNTGTQVIARWSPENQTYIDNLLKQQQALKAKKAAAGW